MTDKPTLVANAMPAVPVVPVGAFFGFDPLTMVAGFVIGLVVLLHIRPEPGETRTPFMVFLLMAGSAFLAGIFAPLAIAGGIHYFPWMGGVEHGGLRLAAGGLIGAAPHLAPVLWRMWRQNKGAQQ